MVHLNGVVGTRRFRVVVLLRRHLVGLEELVAVLQRRRRRRLGLLQRRRLKILDVDLKRVDQRFEIFGGTVTERTS